MISWQGAFFCEHTQDSPVNSFDVCTKCFLAEEKAIEFLKCLEHYSKQANCIMWDRPEKENYTEVINVFHAGASAEVSSLGIELFVCLDATAGAAIAYKCNVRNIHKILSGNLKMDTAGKSCENLTVLWSWQYACAHSPSTMQKVLFAQRAMHHILAMSLSSFMVGYFPHSFPRGGIFQLGGGVTNILV